ncbi:tRNA-splicing endonuclease subunit Sen54-like [Ylistrum balloti]|uniref:tRNA-splicing endonuclease subunit Sen54-like n=1 Tax=Ylistrum balloti TaxID=509963 RepID=UPI002905C881|nr:tRNA-splicing endonuclease subunit Sen54-like [Ylistrum balloti]
MMDDTTSCKMPNSTTLLENRVLSAQEIFKYRRPLDKTVPNRGGAKDFEPDGSFLQSKWIESLSQERFKVLKEQRVEREGGLVKGEWNKDRQLVELEREMGKFWTYMGFVDSSRKWLFPEEALFLMETNTLVVNYKGLPISIQQAYTAFLGTVALTTECYQVYSHLRRLGYVVLRHQGCLDVTTYERKIHLDQHVKMDKKKRKHKGDNTSDTSGLDQLHKKVKVALDDSDKELMKEQLENSCPEKCASLMDLGGSSISEGVIEDRCDSNGWNTSGSTNQTDTGIKESDLAEECDGQSVPYSVWEFDRLGFPNIGGVEVLELQIPRLDLLPHGVDLSKASTIFNVQTYLSQQRKHLKKHHRQQQQECIENLEFSYSEMIHKQTKIMASNWGEFKKKMAIRDMEDKRVSPAQHLWEGEITPLVRPSDATSTGSILNRLQIIESVNLTKGPRSQIDTPSTLPGGTIFDVYLPDAKFRKSRPGLPNYRVCVSKIHEKPPNLQEILSTQRSFPDGVPVSWAVLDHGDIAFYQFTDISLPQEVSMG